MCKTCNNNYDNCPACSDKHTERSYDLDFAFEIGNHDVNIIGDCYVSMSERRIIELVGEAYLTDKTGKRIARLEIDDYEIYVWSAIFGTLEMVRNENKFTEYEN